MTVVTLTTDFGVTDPFVGIMKGVLATRAPDATVIDVSHGVPPQDVLAGGLVLRHAVPYFPPAAIHVAVVDPGVGGSRRAICVATTAGTLLVGPDNGVLSLAAPPPVVARVVHLTEERFFLSPRSATFHGRDVFAPVAAALANGTDPAALGPTITDIERLEIPAVGSSTGSLRGQVIYVDHFGNLTTNVTETDLADEFTISVAGVRLRGVSANYAAVPPGEPVAVINSWGLLEIAVRDGSARETVGAKVGDAVIVERP
jgi:S-adenosyl-L-methionine hydrolase (adenosine-forming)